MDFTIIFQLIDVVLSLLCRTPPSNSNPFFKKSMDGHCLLNWSLLNDAWVYFFTILCTSVRSLFVGETVRGFRVIFIWTLGFYFISEPLNISPQVSICGN